MAKHIGRISKDNDVSKKSHSKDISAEDEWSHVTNIDAKKPQEQDPMLPQNRVITFTNKFSNLSKEELVRVKSEKLKDELTNTDQYFRYANGTIKERINRLQQIKDDEKRFQNIVEMLQQKIKSRFDLEHIDPKYITPDEARSLVFHLEEEFERLRDKLLYQELIVQKTKDEITNKRKQVQEIKDELKDILHTKTKPVQTDPITTLKIELKKAGVSEASKIFQILDDVAEQLYEKNAKNAQG